MLTISSNQEGAFVSHVKACYSWADRVPSIYDTGSRPYCWRNISDGELKRAAQSFVNGEPSRDMRSADGPNLCWTEEAGMIRWVTEESTPPAPKPTSDANRIDASVCVLVTAMGMLSENMQRIGNGEAIAYPESAFQALLRP